MKRRTSTIIPKKSIIPFIIVSLLFALWGFANSITDPMVQAFKKVLELSNVEAAWVQMSFYGGYFSMAIPAALFLRKYSYKKGILVGLGLYAIGAFLFYPATIFQQFWFFCLGLYILTFGLAFLETTASPYILSMGEKKTAIQRLNLAQFFNPMGLILGLLVAQNFILKNLKSDNIVDFSSLDEYNKTIIKTSDLIIIRDPYLILGFFVTLFFLIIFFYNMPDKKTKASSGLSTEIKRLFQNKQYTRGVLAQVFYVGSQIMCWTYIYHYCESIGINNSEAANYQFIAFILFFSGRGVGTLFLNFVNSKTLMTLFSISSMILTVGTVFVGGKAGLYFLIIISFFMSIMFPTIYGVSLSKLNENEKKIGAAGLVMAIVGGAIMPMLQGIIIDIGGVGLNDVKIFGISEINLSFILPLICFSYITYYSRTQITKKSL